MSIKALLEWSDQDFYELFRYLHWLLAEVAQEDTWRITEPCYALGKR